MWTLEAGGTWYCWSRVRCGEGLLLIFTEHLRVVAVQ